MLVVVIGLNFVRCLLPRRREFWFAGNQSLDPSKMAPLSYIVGGDTGRFVAFWEMMALSVFAFTFAPEVLVIIRWWHGVSLQRILPKTSKRYFYKLTFFYCFSALAIDCICLSNVSELIVQFPVSSSDAFV
jgi:amino acid permease